MENLLNRATLRLSPEVQVARLGGERVVAKYQPGARHVVMTPREWELLQHFREPRTVPAVLLELISGQSAPALGEFYQLVVQAADAGVLQADTQPPPPEVKPVRWPVKLPGALVRWSALIAAAAAVGLLFWRPVEMPRHPGWLAAGWLVACGAISLGWMLAASVVRAGGGEVYRPRVAWKTLWPGLRFDLVDAILLDKAGRTDVALARLAPLLAAVALAAWKYPPLSVPLLVGLLLELSPLWSSPLAELLAARWRDPQLATSFGFKVARNRLFTLLRHARRQLRDHKYLFACAVATVAWLALAALVGAGLLQASALELWQRFSSAGGWRYTALGLLGLLVALVLGAAGMLAAMVASHVRTWWQERTERRLRPQAVLVSAQTVADWLGRTLLFRSLAPADLEALAAVVKPEEHKRGSFVVREGEAGDRLYVVLSGRVEIRRDYAPGRSEAVAEMGEGEVFGEIALLQGGVRTRSVRALERTILLSLGKMEFEQLVLTRLSRDAVLNEVQKVGFLQQVELTRNSQRAALAAFAERAQLREMPEGTVVMREGEANHWFYLVHRGELAVQLKGRELRRLKQGDSFGELSLLGDGIATSSVVVRSKLASCLVVAGPDFLRFITHDFAAGMKWEQLRPQRLELGR